MINLKIKHFNGKEIGLNEEFDFNLKELPITKLIEDTIKKTSKIKNIINPNFRGEKLIKKGNIPEPSSVELEVVLMKKEEDLLSYWEVSDDVLGFQCISSGAFEMEDSHFLSAKHRVAIIIDEEKVKNYTKDIESLKSYLVTITHEIAHAVEWIENTNGLTPAEVQTLIDEGSTEFSLMDITSGNGFIFDYNKNLSYTELEDIMEYRVEMKGRDWLNEINLDPSLLKEVMPKTKKNNKRKLF